jgi:hypothetical protein
LKDRAPRKGLAGRELNIQDISHYKKVLFVINNTMRFMSKIDEVIEKNGGWPGAFVAGIKLKM